MRLLGDLVKGVCDQISSGEETVRILVIKGEAASRPHRGGEELRAGDDVSSTKRMHGDL